MSFRQFGGIQYAPKHNIVSSNYNTSNNLQVTQVIGQPNSYINVESDISGNIKIFGNVDISGNLIVRENVGIAGDLGVKGDTDISGNLSVQQDANIAGDLGVQGYATISDDSFINGVTIGKGGGNESNNTVLGVDALQSNTTGNQNVAIGPSTMQLNQTGNYNVAIGGSDCLNNNLSGSYNIAIGAYSLNLNQTGKSNIAVGNYSLNNCDQSYNVAVGSGSMQFGTIIHHNSALGYHSAQYDISGNNNTYLGSNTGQPKTDTNIYTYSTAIGANAVITDSNQIMVGGKNASGNYPYTIIPGGNVSIGKTTMNSVYNLDVSGNINLTGSLYQNGSPYIFPGTTQWTTSGSNIYYKTGNVGIGTNNPSYTLDVSGNARIISGYGISSTPTFTLSDSSSSNNTLFLPNAGAGNYIQ